MGTGLTCEPQCAIDFGGLAHRLLDEVDRGVRDAQAGAHEPRLLVGGEQHDANGRQCAAQRVAEVGACGSCAEVEVEQGDVGGVDSSSPHRVSSTCAITHNDMAETCHRRHEKGPGEVVVLDDQHASTHTPSLDATVATRDRPVG